MELFFLRKIHRICPRHRGPGPPTPADGSMNFIKRQPLASGSMAQIDPSEPLSRLLISVVHHRSDGRGGWLRSLSFLELRWSASMRFAPTRSQRWGERVYANLNQWRAATEPDNGEAARPVLGDGVGGLRWSFVSMDMRQGFLELLSTFSTNQLLRSVVENSNLVAT
jgi:hypothetical protein